MPLYEYRCHQCDSQVELLIRGSEQPVCPNCQSKKLEKLLSVAAAPIMSSGSLPVCNTPQPSGGCGKPQCGSGGCMFGN